MAHIIYALGTGGLENGLVNILNRSPPGRYRHAIICLTEAGDFSARLTDPGVEIIELHKRPGHDLGMYWRLYRALRCLRPAIVHSRNLAALETQLLGLLFPGCKRVHGEHGRDVHDLDGSVRRYQRLRRLLQPLIHRFITVSADLQQWLVGTVGIPARKVCHIYNGVDHERFSPRQGECPLPLHLPPGFLPDGCRVVGTVGRLAAVKDQGTLIRALGHIFSESPMQRHTLRCILVGEGPERPALERCIAEQGLGDTVWLAGDREDIPELLACLDVFVLPSLGEGISNTVLEAMATGLPVIATRVGGNPELVDHGVSGLLVPAGDAAALAQAMGELLDGPARCEQMGRMALQRARTTFDWDTTVAEYLQVYDELLVDVRPRGSRGAPG